MTDEEARYAFNNNMMATGLLSEYPAEFAQEHGRRWLVSSYEAGDVVFHKPHAVCPVLHPSSCTEPTSSDANMPMTRSTHRRSTMTQTM